MIKKHSAIKQWRARPGGDLSPMTGLPFVDGPALIPNHILKAAIEDWKMKGSGSHFKDVHNLKNNSSNRGAAFCAPDLSVHSTQYEIEPPLIIL